LAEKCGVAFQITNIIRDVREDREIGRCYLPLEDRNQFPNLIDLLEFEAARAKAYYSEAAPLVGMVHRESRASLWALIEIYRRLLQRIEESGYDVMRRRIRLSTLEKLSIVAQAVVRPR
jgi:phytoene synthase